MTCEESHRKSTLQKALMLIRKKHFKDSKPCGAETGPQAKTEAKTQVLLPKIFYDRTPSLQKKKKNKDNSMQIA